MEIVDEIVRGETYYREFPLYSDAAKTQVLDWSGKTPRGVLLNLDGSEAATLNCSVLEPAGDLPKRLAVAMPRAGTYALSPARRYEPSIMLDSADGTSVSAITGTIKVRNGAAPPA